MKDLTHTIEDALAVLNPKGRALPTLAEHLNDASELDTIGTNNFASGHPAEMYEAQIAPSATRAMVPNANEWRR